tara:strand:+ start:72 stop:491 length:420 start_codon:yes stop_codon:yes gene_type:complete
MISICTPRPNVQDRRDQWGYAIPSADISAVYVIDPTDEPLVRPFHDGIKILALSELVGDVVIVQPLSGANVQGTQSLVDYVHPTDATYVFWHDDEHMTTDDLAGVTPDALVYIPTSDDTQLYSASAMMVVMYDRLAKGG